MSIGEMTRRDRKREETRETLLHVALDLFAEQGFAATTIEDIAERADVAPRTFFRYFPTKQAVLQPPVDDYRAAFRAAFSAHPRGEPLIDGLQRAVRATLVRFHEDRDQIRRQHQISIDAGLDIGADEFANLWRGFMEDVASHLGLEPDSADQRPALLTGLAVGITTGAVQRWLADDAIGDLGKLVDEGFVTLRALVCNSGTT